MRVNGHFEQPEMVGVLLQPRREGFACRRLCGWEAFAFDDIECVKVGGCGGADAIIGTHTPIVSRVSRGTQRSAGADNANQQRIAMPSWHHRH